MSKGHLPLVQNDPTGSVSPPLVTNSTSPPTANLSPAAKAIRAAQVIVISSVTFTFISYWRTAAVVLCDLASTAYYIGAIVESAIGKAAPWFIMGVLLFSYGMRSVYIESSALFVRGGVYRVVKEAMGGFVAKLSVSALLFDYILTGPISGVAAGQYIVGLGLDAVSSRYFGVHLEGSTVRPSRTGGPSSSPARSRSIFSAKTCWACTNRATRPSRSCSPPRSWLW